MVWHCDSYYRLHLPRRRAENWLCAVIKNIEKRFRCCIRSKSDSFILGHSKLVRCANIHTLKAIRYLENLSQSSIILFYSLLIPQCKCFKLFAHYTKFLTTSRFKISSTGKSQLIVTLKMQNYNTNHVLTN